MASSDGAAASETDKHRKDRNRSNKRQLCLVVLTRELVLTQPQWFLLVSGSTWCALVVYGTFGFNKIAIKFKSYSGGSSWLLVTH